MKVDLLAIAARNGMAEEKEGMAGVPDKSKVEKYSAASQAINNALNQPKTLKESASSIPAKQAIQQSQIAQKPQQ